MFSGSMNTQKREVVLVRRIGVVLGVAAVMATVIALTAGTALAQAQSDTFVTRDPVMLRLPNPCMPGEEIFFEGTFQVVGHDGGRLPK
jgi:hypothetical protein